MELLIGVGIRTKKINIPARDRDNDDAYSMFAVSLQSNSNSVFNCNMTALLYPTHCKTAKLPNCKTGKLENCNTPACSRKSRALDCACGAVELELEWSIRTYMR